MDNLKLDKTKKVFAICAFGPLYYLEDEKICDINKPFAEMKDSIKSYFETVIQDSKSEVEEIIKSFDEFSINFFTTEMINFLEGWETEYLRFFEKNIFADNKFEQQTSQLLLLSIQGHISTIKFLRSENVYMLTKDRKHKYKIPVIFYTGLERLPNKYSDVEKQRKEAIRNSLETSTQQLIFLFKELQLTKIINPNITSIKLGEIIGELTGYSSEGLRQDLSDSEIVLYEKDQIILKSKLLEIIKRIDSMK